MVEALKLFCYILTTTVLVIFFGIPSIITGIKEWDGDCSKWVCIIFIVFGVSMCVGAPVMIWICW